MRRNATVMAVGMGVALSLSMGEASAQSRVDVGLLLGSTRATDEGAVLQFDRGTTYQATFAWRIVSTDAASLVHRSAVHRVAGVHRCYGGGVVASGIRIAVPDARYPCHRPPGLTDLVLRRDWRRLRPIFRIEAQSRPEPQP